VAIGMAVRTSWGVLPTVRARPTDSAWPAALPAANGLPVVDRLAAVSSEFGAAGPVPDVGLVPGDEFSDELLGDGLPVDGLLGVGFGVDDSVLDDEELGDGFAELDGLPIGDMPPCDRFVLQLGDAVGCGG
jgi:hypothetical protein